MCLQTDLHIKFVFWTAIGSIFLLLAAAAIGVVEGFRVKAIYVGYSLFLDSHYEDLCKSITALSIILIFILILTLIALFVDWYPLLLFNGILIGVLSTILLCFGVWLVLESNDIYGKHSILLRTVRNLELLLEQPDNLSFNNTLLDPLQKEFQCCGIYDWKDYWKPLTKVWMSDILPLPKSCCVDPESNCKPNTEHHRQNGCLGKLVEFTIGFFSSFGVITFNVAISCYILMGLVLILAKRAKDLYYFYPYFM